MANKDRRARGGAWESDNARSSFPQKLWQTSAHDSSRPRREAGIYRGRRGRASGAKVARFERVRSSSSCQRPEVRGVSGSCSAGPSAPGPGNLLRLLGSRLASPRVASPRLTWTEVMGDSKEAGTEAPPAGAAARGGLSLLSQGESEEPSAQVSPRWGGTCRAPWAAGPLGPGGMSRFPAASGAFSTPPRRPPKRSGSPCACRCTQAFTCRSFVSKAVLASQSKITDR